MRIVLCNLIFWVVLQNSVAASENCHLVDKMLCDAKNLDEVS
jgi:hypothetical protein